LIGPSWIKKAGHGLSRAIIRRISERGNRLFRGAAASRRGYARRAMAMRITIATARPRTTGTIRALIIDTSCLPNETRKAAVPLPDEPGTLRRAMRGVPAIAKPP
jgi:hypothetical protein